MATPAAFSAERIRTVRALFGLTQKELAHEAGVSQSLLSNVELGKTEVTEDLLQAVARATATPRSFFDVVPSHLPLDSLRFRKYSTASAKDTARAKTLFAEVHRAVVGLAKWAQYPTPNLPLVKDELDHDDIENVALDVRAALRLGEDGPIPNVIRSLERAGVATVPVVFPGDNDPDTAAMPGHFGLSYWAGRGEHALVGYFPGSKPDRDRFTLSHELGHIVLHGHRDVHDPEDEANRFASAFLMPRERAKELLGPDLVLMDYARLKAIWGMSIQALIFRAHHCGRITADRKRSLFIQLSARGWRKNEPVVMHPEEPRLVWKLLTAKFGATPYSIASEPMALPPVLLRSLAPQPKGHVPPPRQPGAVLPFVRR
jgi:Zn-dependent peptidase ImmA (M78 family)/transcriptional regulator with XRE-family HTH domain